MTNKNGMQSTATDNIQARYSLETVLNKKITNQFPFAP